MKNQEIFDNGENFEPSQVSTLMDFLETKIPSERILEKDFYILHEKLIKIKAYGVVKMFSANKGDLMED